MPNTSAATISSIRFSEQSSTPATPASGFSSVYMKADGLYLVDDAAAASRVIVATPTTAAKNTIVPSADVAALTLKAFSDSTTIVFDIQRSTGNGVFQVEDEGGIHFGNATDVEPVLTLRTPTGSFHYLYWATNSNNRWELRTIGAEGGSNAGTDLALNSSTDAGGALNSNVIFIKRQTGCVGIGSGAPAGQLHVDQASTTGAVPVILLDQADVSEEFIRLIGESTTDATQSLVDAANLATPGSVVGWFKIYVEDVQGTGPITDGVYYVPFYTAPTA